MSDPAVELLRTRKRAYSLAATNPAIQEMLADLASFCHAVNAGGIEEKAGPVDVSRVMIMVGRQQVFDRIQRHLNLSIPDLYRIYTGRGLAIPTGEDDASE